MGERFLCFDISKTVAKQEKMRYNKDVIIKMNKELVFFNDFFVDKI